MQDNPFESYNAFPASWKEHGDFAEERWWDLGTYSPTLIIPEKYAADFGLDRSKHSFVTFEDRDDIAHEGFPATFQMMHQLHCIDFLRQGLYINHEHYRKLKTIAWLGSAHHEDRLQVHLLHCVDALRQATLCHADIRVHPYLTSTNATFGDFTIPRKCRNWAAVRDFARDPNNGYTSEGTIPIDSHHDVQMEGVERWPVDRLWRGL